MVRAKLNIGCRYSTPVRERPLHPTRRQFTLEASQTQARVTPATKPDRCVAKSHKYLEALKNSRLSR